MEVYARELYKMEGELSSLIKEQKAIETKGRALDGKLKQMDAEIKKMQEACKKAMKEVAAQKAKAKTPAQKNQFEAYANKMMGQTGCSDERWSAQRTNIQTGTSKTERDDGRIQASHCCHRFDKKERRKKDGSHQKNIGRFAEINARKEHPID